MYNKLDQIFNEVIPKTHIPQSATFPKWFTADIIFDLKNKEYHRQRAKRDKSAYHEQRFKELRKSLKMRIKQARANYIAKAETNIISDPNCFWNYTKSLSSNTKPSREIKVNNKLESDPQVIADGFAEFFSSVFVSSDITFSNNSIPDLIGNLAIPGSLDIIRYCKKLPNKWSAGTDGIPCCIVRECAEAFSIPLTIIIQSSIIHGTFPDIWKQSKVCPIPKTGNLTDVTLSRPIAILCSFSKVLEMYIYETVFSEFQPIVSPLQHGFMPKRSTVTNLVYFTQLANETLTAGEQLDTA
ncbi:uncharacterized protein LOC123272246 [Cotesia glomerata]|uniref:uncharacterized protein LOC123272246 n=1 Tax=Cotesia glomerata TaxID=32391 RepID=UPI001D021F91|nr:uncharacterized protein LOC123272246 [Cotesia glomerata]